MRTLGTFQKFYSEIPKSIHSAVDRAQKLDAAIENMTNSLNQSLADFDELTGSIDKHVKEASRKALNRAAAEMRGASDDFRENLTIAMKESLPLSELKEAGKTFSDTIAASNAASSELRNNINVARRTQIGVIACAALSMIFASWLVFHFRYTSWLEESRRAAIGKVIEQIDDNRAVLNELALANRRLELSRSESGAKTLAISNAEGYTSTAKAGVIVFK